MYYYKIASVSGISVCLSLLSISCVAQTDGPILVGPKERQKAPTQQQIEQATAVLSQATESYQRHRKLAARGSVSASSLQQSKLDRDVAALELKALQNPESASKARLEIAKKRLKVAESDFEKSKRLFSRGSISTLRYRRSKYRLNNAKIVYNAASGRYSVQSANLLLAKSQLALAEIELELGEQLYQRRAIPKSTYQALLVRVRDAKTARAELEQLQNKQQQTIDQRIGT